MSLLANSTNTTKGPNIHLLKRCLCGEDLFLTTKEEKPSFKKYFCVGGGDLRALYDDTIHIFVNFAIMSM